MVEEHKIEDTLTPHQVKAMRALLTTRTQKEAAEKAGISTVTLWRWGKLPAFQAAFKACLRAEMDALLEDIRNRRVK